MAGERLAFTPGLREGRASRPLERRSHPAGSHAKGAEGEPTLRVVSAAAPASSLTIAVGRALGTVVVTLRGNLTGHDAPTLTAILGDLINNQGNLNVVMDMRRLSSASSSGLAALAVAAMWAAERRATFRLSEPVPALREKLVRLGLIHGDGVGVEGLEPPAASL